MSTTASTISRELRSATHPVRSSGRIPAGTLYLDVLRAVAILLVLIVHASSPVLHDQPVGSIRWWAACIYGSVARCCVPLFVMVSGSLLLDPARRPESPRAFFRKRAMKVVIPWLAWSVLYLFFAAWLAREPMTPLLRHPWADTKAILAGPVFYHLWFVYVILGLYVATPILRVFVRAAGAAELAYFVGAWLVASSLLPLAGHFLHLEIGLSFYVAEGYCGYFLLGHVLRGARVPFSRATLGCALGGSILLTIVATRLTSGRSGALDPTFFDYLAPNIVLMSMAAFLLCRDLPHGRWRQQRPRAYRSLALVASGSWGVYLVHPLFMETLQRGRFIHVRFDGSVLFGWLGIPLIAVAMLGASLGLVLSMRRVEGLASFVP